MKNKRIIIPCRLNASAAHATLVPSLLYLTPLPSASAIWGCNHREITCRIVKSDSRWFSLNAGSSISNAAQRQWATAVCCPLSQNPRLDGRQREAWGGGGCCLRSSATNKLIESVCRCCCCCLFRVRFLLVFTTWPTTAVDHLTFWQPFSLCVKLTATPLTASSLGPTSTQLNSSASWAHFQMDGRTDG